MAVKVVRVDLVHASNDRAYVESKLSAYRVAVVTDEANRPLLLHDGQNIRELAYSDGSFQPLDADLTAIAGITGPGLLVKTTTDPAAPVWAVRTLQTGAGITITGGDGVSGNPQITCTITQYTDGEAVAAIKNDSAWHATNWDTAHSWGDHHLMGYLTSASISETDPIFSASAAHGITATQVSHWNSAYTWGNHALAGYLTIAGSPDLVAIEALTGIGIAGRTAANTWALSLLTVNTIPMASTAGVLVDSMITQDIVNSRIGVGTTSPATRFHIYEDEARYLIQPNGGTLLLQNGSAAGDVGIEFEVGNNEQRYCMGISRAWGDVFTIADITGGRQILTYSPSQNLLWFNLNSVDMDFTIMGSPGLICTFDGANRCCFFPDNSKLTCGGSPDYPTVQIKSDGTNGRIKANIPNGTSAAIWALLQAGELYYCNNGLANKVFQK